MTLTYLKDPTAIYALSFATIRAECDLSAFNTDEQDIAIRMVHASGDASIVHDIKMSGDFVSAAQNAVTSGRPIYVDAEMVRQGIIGRDHLNIICTLNDQRARALGVETQTTRSAAAVDFWDDLGSSLCVIGNAPTALFRLLERIAETQTKPAAIIALPVGFVGAAESKQALIESGCGVPYVTLPGRRGGSALAAAAFNAVARGLS